MAYVVFLNGPPGSGKDHAARFIVERLSGNRSFIARTFKFATELKRLVHLSIGLPQDIDHDTYFESVKDVPLAIFNGHTPREAYIAYSERYMKPIFGETVWADRLWNSRPMQEFVDQISHITPEFPAPRVPVVLISDPGFLPECERFSIHFQRVTLLHIECDGGSFDKDSRSYLNLDGKSRILPLPRTVRNDRGAQYREALHGEMHRFLYR